MFAIVEKSECIVIAVVVVVMVVLCGGHRPHNNVALCRQQWMQPHTHTQTIMLLYLCSVAKKCLCSALAPVCQFLGI